MKPRKRNDLVDTGGAGSCMSADTGSCSHYDETGSNGLDRRLLCNGLMWQCHAAPSNDLHSSF